MREIKFRAWIGAYNRIGAQMYYFRWHQIMELGTVHVRDENGNFCEVCLGCDEVGEDGHPIIMQYTGLGDKNGKEIYEGDIVKIRDYYRIVEWDNEMACFAFKENTSWAWGWEECQTPSTSEWEVIGNIYENPELIGDKHGKV